MKKGIIGALVLLLVAGGVYIYTSQGKLGTFDFTAQQFINKCKFPDPSDAEKEAMYDFRGANNVDAWRQIDGSTYNRSSESNPCCRDGVGCQTHNDKGEITSLMLTRVFGSRTGSNASMKILPTISSLQNLTYLSLNGNNISETLDNIASLGKLKVLEVAGNLFYGTIPNFASSSLERINISTNNFGGSIPSHFAEQTHLTELYINNNEFCGIVPSEFKQSSIDYFKVGTNKLIKDGYDSEMEAWLNTHLEGGRGNQQQNDCQQDIAHMRCEDRACKEFPGPLPSGAKSCTYDQDCYQTYMTCESFQCVMKYGLAPANNKSCASNVDCEKVSMCDYSTKTCKEVTIGTIGFSGALCTSNLDCGGCNGDYNGLDMNNDGKFNSQDRTVDGQITNASKLTIVQAYLLKKGIIDKSGNVLKQSAFDINGDGYIDQTDINIMINILNGSIVEICGDHIDNNCNGVADEDC